jgi:hypothetical protein
MEKIYPPRKTVNINEWESAITTWVMQNVKEPEAKTVMKASIKEFKQIVAQIREPNANMFMLGTHYMLICQNFTKSIYGKTTDNLITMFRHSCIEYVLAYAH